MNEEYILVPQKKLRASDIKLITFDSSGDEIKKLAWKTIPDLWGLLDIFK
jgi:hypothetical protein